MELWEMAGRPSEKKPSWADRGEWSVIGAINISKGQIDEDETVIALVDDREARRSLRTLRTNIDMMGTRTFIRWMAEDFGATNAESAWAAIVAATDMRADPGEADDPVFIRNTP